MPLFLQTEMREPEEVVFYLLLDLVIIIVAARIAGSVANRLGQPRVIGEVLAGIILGPTLLGQIDADIPSDIFPRDIPLKSLADLGLIFFMFLVGLELDTRLLKGQGARAVQISLSGILGPLTLGVLVGLALYSVNNEGVFPAALEAAESGAPFELPSRTTFALFLGAAMCITAFPVLARILVESGLYKTAVGTTLLCAAAVDDAIAWLLLAAVVGIAESGSPVEALPAIGLAAAFVVFMLLIGQRLLELLARRYDTAGRLTIDQVAIVLAGVLLSALITQQIGIHYIFGAFVFGAVMPKRAGMTKEITDKVEDFVVIVMLPVFFLVAGLRTDLFTLNSPSLIGWLLLILLVAVAGKFLGTGIAARVTGSSWRDSVVIGSLMNTRGLTELVILTIGLNLGVLSDRTFAMMVIMALSTTFMAAPIVNFLMPREQLLRELAEPEKPAPMAMRILVAIAQPQTAQPMVDVALRLVGNCRPAELLLVQLIPAPRAPELRTGLLDEEIETAGAVESMRRLVDQSLAAGVGARPLSFLSDDFGKDISSLASDQQCDLVLLAWDDTAPETAAILVRHALSVVSADVLAFVDPRGQGIRELAKGPVIVPLSGGSHDTAAAELALRFAESLDTSVKLIGYAGRRAAGSESEESKRLALLADELRQKSGCWIVPDYHPGDATDPAVEDSATAMLAVVGISDDWITGRGLGTLAGGLLERLACPMVFVRSARGVGAPEVALRPEAAPDWPFIIPVGVRTDPPAPVRLPPQAHLQRLGPYGDTLEALTIGGVLSIGRAPDNRLALGDDNLVSRAHAAVEQRDGTFAVRDLSSTNGTFLWRDREWKEVKDEVLHNGDLLVIGANVFRFSEGSGHADA